MSLICVVSVYPGVLAYFAGVFNPFPPRARTRTIYLWPTGACCANERGLSPSWVARLHRKITRSFVGGTEHRIEREEGRIERHRDAHHNHVSGAGRFCRLPKSQNISIGTYTRWSNKCIKHIYTLKHTQHTQQTKCVFADKNAAHFLNCTPILRHNADYYKRREIICTAHKYW